MKYKAEREREAADASAWKPWQLVYMSARIREAVEAATSDCEAELHAAVELLRRISRGYVNLAEFRAIVAAYDAKHEEGK